MLTWNELNILSYGAGTPSTALALMSCQNAQRGPPYLFPKVERLLTVCKFSRKMRLKLRRIKNCHAHGWLVSCTKRTTSLGEQSNIVHSFSSESMVIFLFFFNQSNVRRSTPA